MSVPFTSTTLLFRQRVLYLAQSPAEMLGLSDRPSRSMFTNVRFERHHRLSSLYQVLKTFRHISSTLCLWSSITACSSANLTSSFIWSTMAHAVVRFELCAQSIQLLHHLGHSYLFLFRRVMLPRTIAQRLCTFIVPDLDIIPTRTQSRHRARYSILSGSNNQCSRPDWFSFILPVHALHTGSC